MNERQVDEKVKDLLAEAEEKMKGETGLMPGETPEEGLRRLYRTVQMQGNVIDCISALVNPMVKRVHDLERTVAAMVLKEKG